jgi:hypothetical protein
MQGSRPTVLEMIVACVLSPFPVFDMRSKSDEIIVISFFCPCCDPLFILMALTDKITSAITFKMRCMSHVFLCYLLTSLKTKARRIMREEESGVCLIFIMQ